MQEFHCPARTRPARPARAILLAMAAAALGLASGRSPAHAIIVAARPAMNATVAQGDLDIRLDFNSRIDPTRSRLSLQRPDGTEAAVALAPSAAPGVLAGRAEATMSGQWKLNWMVLSLDGHITRGEVIFSVRGKPSAP